MGHIHTKSGQYDFTVSAFIVRTDYKEPKIMLHRHKRFAKYMQFGGHVELDESPWQALIHEIKEEVGYEINQLKILQPQGAITKLEGAVVHPLPVVINSHAYPGNSDHYHTDLTFAFVTDQEPKLKPADGESRDIKILSLKEVKSLKNEVISNVAATAEEVITDTLNNWQIVEVSEFSN